MLALSFFYGIGSKQADVTPDGKQTPETPDTSQVSCRPLGDGMGGGIGVWRYYISTSISFEINNVT